MFFIGGYPRTGTTLVHALLCGDERTNGLVGECTLITHTMQAYVSVMTAPHQHAIKDYWKDLDDFHVHMKDFLDRIIESFKEIQQCEIPVFKSPYLVPFLPALAQMYPEAKFVCTVRDPLDVMASLKKVKRRYLRKDNPPPDPFMDLSLLQMINGYAADMMVLNVNSAAFGGKRLMYVKYEGLVNYPGSVVSKLSEFTGLDCELKWEGLEYVKDQPFYSDMWAKPISKKRVGSWKKVLNDEEVHVIKSVGHFINHRFAYGGEEEDGGKVKL